MSNIIVYSKQVCPYCVRAKALLKRKGADFKEIMVVDEETRDEMLAKSNGMMTVPQIFIGDFHVGGYNELEKLNKKGELDELLNK